MPISNPNGAYIYVRSDTFYSAISGGVQSLSSPAFSRGELDPDGCDKDSDNSYLPAGVGGHPRLQPEIAQGAHRAVPNSWQGSLKKNRGERSQTEQMVC